MFTAAEQADAGAVDLIEPRERLRVEFLTSACSSEEQLPMLPTFSTGFGNKLSGTGILPIVQVLAEKHKLATRWFHWVNFPLLGVMIYSGLLIYWANDIYRVGVGGLTVFHFFPDWVYQSLGLGRKLSFGMAIHFLVAWLFTFNGIAYVFYTGISGEWRELLPNRQSFADAIQVVKHDLGVKAKGVRVPLPPQRVYNGAQRITYSLIIAMGVLSVLSGLAIYKPIQISWLTSLLGGYEAARFEHFWLTMGYVGFFGIHIGQVVKAGWGNFRSMVTGYELTEVKSGE